MDMFRHRGAPILSYPTFLSTIVLTDPENPTGATAKYFKITGVLFDSGASSNFISRDLCKKLNKRYYLFTQNREYNTANGKISRGEEVDLFVSVAGVFQKLCFVVGDDKDCPLLLGTPAFWKYKLEMKWSHGPQQETLVTIRTDRTIQTWIEEEKEIVVEADRRYGPSMTIELKDNRVRAEATKLGESLQERQERIGAEAAAVGQALQNSGLRKM